MPRGHGAFSQLLETAVDRRQHERVGLVSFPTHLDDRCDGADVEDGGAHGNEYGVCLEDGVLDDVELQRRRVDDQPLEPGGAKDLDITGDVLDLDQARVHGFAAQNPPLGQVSLIAVEIEHGHALALLRRAHGQR
jgi:hypothetical protein